MSTSTDPENSKASAKPHGLLTVLALAGFIGGAWLLEQWPSLQQARAFSHTLRLPNHMLRYSTFSDVIRQLGLVRSVPNEGHLFPKRDEAIRGLHEAAFSRKRRPSDLLFEVNKKGAAALPSSTQVQPEHLQFPWPILSIHIDPAYLDDPKHGLYNHPHERGMDWERLACMSYFEDGKLSFATSAGLRLHGAGSDRLENRSYRLYFRSEYGRNLLPAEIMFEQEHRPVKTLVVRYKWYRGSSITQPLAHDLAKRVGAVVPETQVVKLIFNGEDRGFYTLCRHVSPRQWTANLGQEDFVYHRYRVSSKQEIVQPDLRNLQTWLKESEAPITMEAAAARINLDLLSRQLFAIMFMGVTDWRQGLAILEKNKPDTKWFWVTWDLDHAFQDINPVRKTFRQPWEQECIELVTANRRWDLADPNEGKHDVGRPRELAFQRLIKDSPAYRAYFIQLSTDLLNHVLTPEVLKDRADTYIGAALDFDLQDETMNLLHEFFLYRPDFFRKDLQKHLNAGDLFTVTIESKAKLLVDGYPVQGPYKGQYFKGTRFSLSLPEDPDAVWQINQQAVTQGEIQIKVQDNLRLIQLHGQGP